MQERRRNQAVQALDPTKERVQVPIHYWRDLEKRDLATLCANTLSTAYSSEDILVPVLGKEILVDRKNRSLKRKKKGEWQPVNYPLLELLVLVYLNTAGPRLLGSDLMSAQELKTGHFFQGPHELNLAGVLQRFGRDLKGFREAAEFLGGEGQTLADVAYRIPAFPKVPLYYLLWEGDEEFEPRLSVLFDRSIESHLSADAIWGLVALVSDALLRAPDLPF
jgi:hypothetical protein